MDLAISGFALVMRDIVTDVVRAELLPIKVDIAELKADVAQLKVDLQKLTARVIKLEHGQEDLLQKYETLTGGQADLQRKYDSLVTGQADLNQKYQSLITGQESLMASMADVRHDIADIKQTLGQNSQQLSELRTGQSYLKSGFRSQAEETARLHVMLEDLRDYLDIKDEEIATSPAYAN